MITGGRSPLQRRLAGCQSPPSAPKQRGAAAGGSSLAAPHGNPVPGRLSLGWLVVGWWLVGGWLVVGWWLVGGWLVVGWWLDLDMSYVWRYLDKCWGRWVLIDIGAGCFFFFSALRFGTHRGVVLLSQFYQNLKKHPRKGWCHSARNTLKNLLNKCHLACEDLEELSHLVATTWSNSIQAGSNVGRTISWQFTRQEADISSWMSGVLSHLLKLGDLSQHRWVISCYKLL